MTGTAQCLSRSCTTGWLDWIHGELWLSPTTLIRRRLTWTESTKHRLGPTVGEPLPQTQFHDPDLARLLAEHPTNKVIRFDSIATARLVRGVTTDGLRLTMHDGTRHKLLWLPRDPASKILRAVLPAVLPDRFATGRGFRS
jgi:hypothetical protein